METKRTLEFGLGLSGAILSFIGIILGGLFSIVILGFSKSVISDPYMYTNSTDYYSYGSSIAAADSAINFTILIVVITLIIVLIGAILSLIGAIKVKNKTLSDRVTSEGVMMLIGGIIGGNLLAMAGGIVALARHKKPEASTPQPEQPVQSETQSQQ